MGSVGSPKSGVPYNAYRDCAQGICNKYCSRSCDFPPPLDTEDSGTTLSPLIIALICILASAFILVSYYVTVYKYCKRRRRRNRRNPNVQAEIHLDEVTHDQWQLTSSGLDEGLIRSITVFKYKKGDGLVEGTECSVCLSEFQENENLRLLPKCCHAFHPPCIDTWLKSQSNCPLCRANAVPIYASLPNPPPAAAAPNPPPPAAAPPQSSSALNISALATQRQNDLVFVIEEKMVEGRPEVILKNLQQADSGVEIPEIRHKKIPYQYESTQLRRSISSDKFPRRQGLMIADIMQMNEDDEKADEEIQQLFEVKIGSSKGSQEEQSK